MTIAVVGAGWSGAVIARELADAGHHVEVFEERPHVGGNCHTKRDKKTGVMVHVYGPHIFHTANKRVWQYVNKHGEWVPYVHRVKAVVKDLVYSMPINLHTINQFYKQNLNPEEAKTHIARLTRDFPNPVSLINPSFEDQALKFIGPDLYAAFLKGYTVKQWGRSPKEIPASVLSRLPLRFNYDDTYFAHPYQAIPRYGYTDVIVNILDHKNIDFHIDAPFTKFETGRFKHTFYSGPLDAWFGHRFGRLGYRTLDFVVNRYKGDCLGCPVLNFCDIDVPHTRITEFKHFMPWEKNEDSITYHEYSRECMPKDIPYYPIRLTSDESMLMRYQEAAAAESNVTFLGRLGTYRYLDMDATIAESLAAADKLLKRT